MTTMTRQPARPRTVADVMTSDVVTAGPDDTARELAYLLWRNAIGGVPVVDDGVVIGLVSGTDVLWLAAREEADVPFYLWDGLDRHRVRDLMTPDVFGVAPTDGLEQLREFFLRAGVHRAPVLDDGRLVGIVTVKDVLGVIACGGPVTRTGEES